jgi:transcriptional regulator with XRE-family HTH domain
VSVKNKKSAFAQALQHLLDIRYPRMSLRKRAAQLNVSPSYLSGLLRGIAEPTPETARQIAAALGVDPEVLLSAQDSIQPLDHFDFRFSSASAWRWCLSLIREKIDDSAWRARFADAIVLFFFIAEGMTSFDTPDTARDILSEIHNKILHCESFEAFNEILFNLFFWCGDACELEGENLKEPESELATNARLLVFHAVLFTEDMFSYLASPSPLQFTYDVQRFAWVNRTALSRVLEFVRREKESGGSS